MRGASRATVAALCAGLALLGLVACGSQEPRRLDRSGADALRAARSQLEEAIATETVLTGSPEQARELISDVRRIAGRRSVRREALDEFGLASLGELNQLAPSLVVSSSSGVERSLDRGATADFLRYASDDPPRALVGPATARVEEIERIVRRANPAPEEIVSQPRPTAPVQPSLRAFLSDIESDLRPIWPQLADRMRKLRLDLEA